MVVVNEDKIRTGTRPEVLVFGSVSFDLRRQVPYDAAGKK